MCVSGKEHYDVEGICRTIVTALGANPDTLELKGDFPLNVVV